MEVKVVGNSIGSRRTCGKNRIIWSFRAEVNEAQLTQVFGAVRPNLLLQYYDLSIEVSKDKVKC